MGGRVGLWAPGTLTHSEKHSAGIVLDRFHSVGNVRVHYESRIRKSVALQREAKVETIPIRLFNVIKKDIISSRPFLRLSVVGWTTICDKTLCDKQSVVWNLEILCVSCTSVYKHLPRYRTIIST